MRALVLMLTAWPFAVSAATTPSPRATPSPGAFFYEQARVKEKILQEKLRNAREARYSASSVNRLARLYIHAGAPEKALAEYRYALVLSPAKASYYHRKMANLLQEMGRGEEAARHRELADLTRRTSPRDLYRQRLADWEREGRYDLLIQEYRYLLRREPQRAASHLRKLSSLAEASGDQAQAEGYLRRLVDHYLALIEDSPDREKSFRSRLVRVHLDLGEYERALAQYDRIDELDESSRVETELGRAKAYLEMGDEGKAVEVLRRLDEALAPGDISARRRLARAFSDLGRVETALKIEQRLAGQPGGENLALLLVGKLSRAGEFPAALEYSERALSFAEGSSLIRLLEERGEILHSLGRREEAVHSWRRALSLREKAGVAADPSGRIWADLAELAARARLPGKAREYRQNLISAQLELASRSRARAPGIYRRLGNRFREEKDFEQARNIYLLWSQEFPGDPGPLYRLYLLHKRDLKDSERARDFLDRYRKVRRDQVPR